MRDFTYFAYESYLKALQNKGYNFILFRDFIPKQNEYSKFCLIRHDIDRRPMNALKMAQLENNLGIKSTYYFRYKPNVFIPAIIKEIENLNHEVGYHYENLSDKNGNLEEAFRDFDIKLENFRKVVTVDTISMHGRPFKSYDNRDMWNNEQRYNLLKEKFNLTGEVYLAIDYTDICYITDTGRNWHSLKNNIRDITNSKILIDFKSGTELLKYFSTLPHSKVVFQVHPERWDDSFLSWSRQWAQDTTINMIKKIIR